MMTKDEYRDYFLRWKKYVRYAPILDELNIPRSNFSQFINQTNQNALSLQKLEAIRSFMAEKFETMIQEGSANGQNL